MAEVKNAFIKSKMNKDLDSRLLPSGEYRNAINAQVSKSEGSDVGSLENVLGNSLVATFSEGVTGLSCIGFFTDQSKSDVYVFLTDNITEIYNEQGVGSNHFIYKYNTQNNDSPVLLVSGAFLNFSKLNPIYGVNLLEKLLFWTDNRNQPRKINVENAATITNYYTTEDQISVAKYYPYEAINLFKQSTLAGASADGSLQYESTMKNVDDKFLPNGGSCDSGSTAIVNSNTLSIDQISIPYYPKIPVTGMKVERVNSVGEIVPLLLNGVNQTITVDQFNTTGDVLTLSGNVDIDSNTELIFNSNPYYSNNYPGDSDLNKDKFIRFSYRFKFSDGEYSLIAPFTQICFIPKQDGYFMTDNVTTEGTVNTYDGDMNQAYGSTIVDFMENKVDEISLQIPLPSIASSLSSDFHIDEIDILYKESDGLAIQVVETIKVSDLSDLNSKVYEYVYQSQKPYKTLPSKEITRVYDKVPVRALGQEIISNRVVYSNFQDKHTPPSSLNYNVSANSKSDFNLKDGEGTVASNVVASTIIPIALDSGFVGVGSIVTSPQAYPSLKLTVLETSGVPVNSITVNEAVTLLANDNLVFNPVSSDSNTTSIVEYPSSSLKSNRNYQVGVVLADKFGRQSTVILSNSKTPITVGSETYVGSTIYSPYSLINPWKWVGNSLKMLFNEGIATQGANPVFNEPGLYNGEITSADYNPLGWYSYKIVVKQTEQEYYNVYTAGATLGLPYNYDGTGVLQKNTSFVTLTNDNINKIPRDLSEIGPQDKSFRSSVILYGRVENQMIDTGTSDPKNVNKQFYPYKTSFTTSSIETLFDIFQVQEFVGAGTNPIPITDISNAFSSFYKSDSNPLIAQITTSQDIDKQFGASNLVIPTTSEYKNITALAIFETKPVESRLDIFWETSTSGLISGLNALVLEDSGAASGFSSFNTSLFTESIVEGGEILENDITPVDSFGVNIDPTIIQSLSMSVTNNNGLDVSSYFTLIDKDPGSPGFYNIDVTSYFIANMYYGSATNTRNFVFTFTLQLNPDPALPLPAPSVFNKLAALSNVAPLIDNGQGDISTNDYFVSATSFGSHIAVNGAADSNPNKYLELQWELSPISPVLQPYFTINETTGQGGALETNIIRAPQTGTYLPGEDFSMKLKVTDAGGAGLSDSIIRNVNTIAPLVVAECKDIYTVWSPTNPGQFDVDIIAEASLYKVEFLNTPASSSGNGFYIYTGYFSDLSGGNTLNDVRLNKTGASTVVDQNADWFFASTKAAVISLYNQSIAGTSNQGSYNNTESAIPNLGDYTIVVR